MEKRHNFWQSKDHNLKRRRENQTDDPIFFICFSSPVSENHSSIWKLSKLIFMGSPLAHYGLQNTWILEVKAVRLGFVPFDSENIHIEESKKAGFTFSIELRTNSKFFRVISWSISIVNCLSFHGSAIVHSTIVGLSKTFTTNISTY